MSKAKLRKEIQSFTQEQLVEVVLAAYDSSDQAKDYFEFFLNPDVNALLEKRKNEIAKELSRNKRGYSKARISNIRKAIKSFGRYGVDVEKKLSLLHSTFRMMLAQSSIYRFSDALNNGTVAIALEYITLADDNGCLEEAVSKIDRALKQLGNVSLCRVVRITINEKIKELTNNN